MSRHAGWKRRLEHVVTTGTISPASPAEGQQFNLTNYSSTVVIPSSIASAAQALGNSSISGTAVTDVDATGASPASLSSGNLTFNAPLPSPIPVTGVALNLPSPAETIGPFTATGGAISLTVDPNISLALVVSGSTLNLECKPYPNNSAQTGIVASAPAGSPASPVIATATSETTSTTQGSSTSTPTSATSTPTTATTTTTPTTVLTGAYELYCPGTPVGNVVLNDAMTSATVSPAAPKPGQSFSVTGYQTVVNLPASLASAAGALQPDLTGSASTQIDASGATPAKTPQGPFNFDVTIPNPVPDTGVALSLPNTPSTISGFTATSGAITIQQDASASLSLTVAGNALALTCTAYPNNSVTPSGITTDAPTASPLAPVIAVAGGGSASTTTVAPVTTTTKAGGGGGSSGGGGSNVVTASSHSLAFTGPGPGVGVLGVIGGVLILLGFALLVLVDAPRRAISRLAFLGNGDTWRRVRTSDLTERLANLNPMGWRKPRNEGVPDTLISDPAQAQPTEVQPMQAAPEQPAGQVWAGYTATQTRGGIGDRFSRLPEVSRELAQTTARHAVRTAQWLLGR